MLSLERPTLSEPDVPRAASDDRARWSAAVLARLAPAVFVTDADGRVLFCNAAADRLAHQCRQVCPHARVSRESGSAPTCPRLTGILRGAARLTSGGVTPGARTVLVAQRPAGAPLDLVSVCLDGAPGEGCAGRAAVAISVSERRSVFAVSDRELQSLYGLTPAEARVTRRLASGRSVSDISRELGVSLNTVRTQLKAAFAKTDTSQQSELAALIARCVASVVC